MDQGRIRALVRGAFLVLAEGKVGRDVRGRAVAAARRMYSEDPGTGGQVFKGLRPAEKALLRRGRRIAVRLARRRMGMAAALDARERARKGWVTRRAGGVDRGRIGIKRLGQAYA